MRVLERPSAYFSTPKYKLLIVAAAALFALVPVRLSGQSGGFDFSIPGVTSRINTSDMVEELMEAERVPLGRMEADLERDQERRSVWNDIGRRLASLRDAASGLFGFENPFSGRMATSDNPAVVTATAGREAPEGEITVTVQKTASRDRFLSRNLPLDYQVPEGRYGFRLGDEEEFVRFRGGTVEEFVARVNDQARDLVRLSSVRNTADSQVVLFEGLREGAGNALVFLEDAEDLAIEAGVVRRTGVSTADIPVTSGAVFPWGDLPAGQVQPSGTDDGNLLFLEPESSMALSVSLPFPLEEGMILELEANVENLGRPEWTPPSPPPGPSLPDVPGASLDDIEVESVPSQVDLPPWQSPQPPQQVTDLSILFAEDSGNVTPLPNLEDTDGFRTFRFPIAELLENLDTLYVRNRNTYRRVTIRNLRVFDPDVRGDFEPINAMSTAGDAELLLNGIPVTRPTNSIDDLYAGTSLQLHRASSDPVSIVVEPDREGAKNGIIEFVGFYNTLLTQIHILTRDNEAIVDEIEYFNDEEREEALEQLGILQGDSTLSTLRQRLQTFMMNPYSTSEGRELTLLAQIGISTNAAAPGARSLEPGRLRGYLEIDESALDSALSSNFRAVKELFGADTDGDFAVDSGAAYSVANFVRPFVQSGGIIATRTSTLDTMISQSEDEIEDFNARLERVEAEYRSEFSEMEGAMDRLQRNSQSLQNIQNSGGGNR